MRPVDDIANRIVDAILGDFPGHADGTRPAHARGVGAQGYFKPTVIAGTIYCKAEPFTSAQTPVTVRFSNSTGLSSVPDVEPDVRGMAVKFHLSSGAECDLVSMTLPVFVARTVDDFLEFTAAAVPVPVRPRARWRTVLDMLALRQSPPPPSPGQATSNAPGVFEFAQSHPFAEMAVMGMSLTLTPRSYAQTAYHAVHAFMATAPDGSVRAVRFHWDPVAGVHPVAATDLPLADDYLRTELGERLAGAPVEFVLRAQLAETGDDTSDPTTAWPWRRQLVEMGRLYVSALVEDQIADCERVSFNPTRLADGIACSDDPILQARGSVYEASYERRIASMCPFGVSGAPTGSP